MFSDQIDQMIKKKISIGVNGQLHTNNRQKNNILKFQTKQFCKSPSIMGDKKLSNNIVIMNMPPSKKVQFFENQIQQYRNVNNKMKVKAQKRQSFFTNPQICQQLRNFQPFHDNWCENNQLIGEHQPFELKRYNSMNIRLSVYGFDDKNQNSTTDHIGKIKKSLIKQDYSHPKSLLNIKDFKPCFKEFFKKDVKIHSKVQNKLKKSEFNYKRAISSSCQSRKKAFQKLLATFQSNIQKRTTQNPEFNKQKIDPQRKNSLKIKQYHLSNSKIRLGSPQQTQKKEKKTQEAYRPWSAGKRNLLKFQSTQEQNPLQFYSINDKN